MAKIEAFKAILSPAFSALDVSADDRVSVGTCAGDLVIAFKGCAIGLGRDRFFVAVFSEGGGEPTDGNENALILLDAFVEKFGEPLPWDDNEVPEWVIGEIDTSYIEIALDFAGCKLSEVEAPAAFPRIVH